MSLEVNTQNNNSFFCVPVSDSTEASSLKKIKACLKDWKDVINERVGHSRQKLQEITEKTEKEQQKEKCEQDRLCKDQYLDLLSNVTSHLQNLSVKDAADKNVFCHLLYDSNQQIQAVSLSRVKDSTLYVSNLLTAPWNLAMNGEVPKDFQSRVVKQAGSSLMQSLFIEGRQKKLTKVELTALKTAFNFYKRLQMKVDESTGVCTYQLSSN